jgi:hypothetical protein
MDTVGFSTASACTICINVVPFNIATLSIKLIVFARCLFFSRALFRNKCFNDCDFPDWA